MRNPRWQKKRSPWKEAREDQEHGDRARATCNTATALRKRRRRARSGAATQGRTSRNKVAKNENNYYPPSQSVEVY